MNDIFARAKCLPEGAVDEIRALDAVSARCDWSSRRRTLASWKRCIRWAFEYTRKKRNSPKKTGSRWWPRPTCSPTGTTWWWRTFQDVAKEYPDVEPDYNHVDACCMWMVKNPNTTT